MSGDKQKAKEMYFNYACNYFFLDREKRTEYEAFGVTRIEELEWRREYIQYWLSKLSVDDMQPLRKLKDTYANEALPSMIRMADAGDSYAKFWFAVAMYDMAKWLFFSPILRIRAMSKAKKLWQSIIQGPIEISDEHKKEINSYMINALNASSPEEYLLNYSKRKLGLQ